MKPTITTHENTRTERWLDADGNFIDRGDKANEIFTINDVVHTHNWCVGNPEEVGYSQLAIHENDLPNSITYSPEYPEGEANWVDADGDWLDRGELPNCITKVPGGNIVEEWFQPNGIHQKRDGVLPNFRKTKPDGTVFETNLDLGEE